MKKTRKKTTPDPTLSTHTHTYVVKHPPTTTKKAREKLKKPRNRPMSYSISPLTGVCGSFLAVSLFFFLCVVFCLLACFFACLFLLAYFCYCYTLYIYHSLTSTHSNTHTQHILKHTNSLTPPPPATRNYSQAWPL